jgi:hypothetical protein
LFEKGHYGLSPVGKITMNFSITGSKIKLFSFFELILFYTIFSHRTEEAVRKHLATHSLKYHFKQ